MKLIKIFLLSFLFIYPTFSKAITLPDSYGGSGQSEQYYAVTFDAEQEASVVAKLTYLNRSKNEIKELNLDIPGNSVRIISILQQQFEQEKTCSKFDSEINHDTNTYPCEQWSTNSYKSTFALIERNESKDQKGSNNIKITLPLQKAIASNQSGSIIIYYKTTGFVTKAWDGYKYNFETIKSPYDIDKVRVAINVSDDLYLKDTAKGQTNYQDNLSQANLLTAGTFSASPALEKVSTDIITSSGVTKETTSLDPNENFKVEGKYYSNQYMGEIPAIAGIVITFLVIIIVLAIIIRSEKKVRRE